MSAFLSRLTPGAKVGIVGTGYVIAFAIAALVVRAYVAATSGADRQAYAAMFDFGDSLLFLGVLVVAGIPATGAAFFFLRSRRTFWRVLSVASLIVACTALAALAIFSWSRLSGGTRVSSWAMFSPLRIFVAPPLALFFLLAGVFAPTRSARISLFSACAMETVAFAAVAMTWWHSTR